MGKIKKIINFAKLTKYKWLNLFSIKVDNKSKKAMDWIFVSRKIVPQCLTNDVQPDAVCIVPFVKTTNGIRLVLIREYRAPINDYEYSFPAGIIESEDYTEAIKRELKEETGLDIINLQYLSKPIYSSAGMTDESVVMAFVTADGYITNMNQEADEDIEVLLFDIEGLKTLLQSDKCIGAKAWGVIYHFVEAGKFPDYFR